MIEKLPFLVLILLAPYQIYRILKASDKNKRIVDILSGGVIRECKENCVNEKLNERK